MRQSTPPRLAERLLRAFLPGGIRADMIVGDLREEFVERSAAQDGHAIRWYLRAGASTALNYLVRRPARSGRLDPQGPGILPPPPPNRWTLAMASFVHDLRYAARTLLKRPTLTLVVVATLALAIGANTSVFSLIDYLLFRPLPIAQQEQVVRIYTSDFSSGPIGASSYPDAVSFDEGITALEQTAVYNGPFPVSLSTDGGGLRLQGEIVSGAYFNVLGIRPERGRLIAPSDQQAVDADAVVVLNHAAWLTYFGGATDIVGRSLILNGEPFVVIGVTEKAFTGIDIGSTPDLWIPVTMYGAAFPGIYRPELLEGIIAP